MPTVMARPTSLASCISSIILSRARRGPYPQRRGEADGDGAVNLAAIVPLITDIVKSGNPPATDG